MFLFLSGITLLEETLIQKGEEDERPSKRARGASKTTVSGDTKVWIELAKYGLLTLNQRSAADIFLYLLFAITIARKTGKIFR